MSVFNRKSCNKIIFDLANHENAVKLKGVKKGGAR